MRFRELTLRRDPRAEPITELIDYEAFCGFPGRPPAAPVDVPEAIPLARPLVPPRGARRGSQG